ncbi:FHA domain-containing protein [Nocardia alni]|uniref:FHA domain-containing protein n=1 Tax=Nocardia alni TaxID=2815723 RepID=UPI001C2346A7|nr:FHA domain-containing protein [Nocardia alni]
MTCPEGHQTRATDYCDVCGAAIGGPEPVTAQVPCPACGATTSGRFCEVCGHDSALPAPETPPAVMAGPDLSDPGPATAESPGTPPDFVGSLLRTPAKQSVWIATVDADRDFFERVLARNGPDAERVEFPGYYPSRRISLQGSDFLIGKRSVSQGVQPDIDMGIAPADIGVSRSHARLHLDEAGITVTDLGSTNGTSLNGSDDLIPAHTPIPLRSGDRIHVGGWTTITVVAE